MPEITTRCKQGKLIVTDEFIRIELGPFKQSTLPRASFSSVNAKLAVPSLFVLGGEVLQADLVKPAVAKEIVDMLSHP